MSYSLKNKIVVLFATAFSFALASDIRAEELAADITPPPAVAAEAPNTDKVAEPSVENKAENPKVENTADDPFGLDDPLAGPESAANDDLLKPADEKAGPRMPDMRDRNVLPKKQDALPQPATMPEVNLDAVAPAAPADSFIPDVAIDAGGPRSPFEKYGNTILSRVDNDLFNQMSEIEKQTTLLNLELKREEVKNRIDALKAQRERAKQEELNMEAEREKKARDEELARQKALLFEQMRLKEKEMELEKIRQAKILNEYMNESLITNQQWVEANGKLTYQIRNLQEERVKLLEEFNEKMDKIRQRVATTMQNAEETRVSYERKISSLNKQIDILKQTIVEKENALQDAENRSMENPFAGGELIDEDAVDMSKEYAIMDITGKGDNIIAKIVGQDGTTFIVRKGSVLKGGETVVSITDKYITFDNHGVRSYLYTAGTVMQYEPTKAFNDATKTPDIANGVKNDVQIRNVRGAGNAAQKTSEKAGSTETSAEGEAAPKADTNSNGGIASFSQGMMVK